MRGSVDVHKTFKEYQPSGARGTRSPPATPHRNTSPPALYKMARRSARIKQLAALGVLAHRLQRRTACNTSLPALSKMARRSARIKKLAAPGALAHRLQRRTVCNTSPPTLSKMADRVQK